MKKLIFILASLMLAQGALAEEGTDFSTGAEYRLRYQYDNNVGFTDTPVSNFDQVNRNAFDQRFKLDLNWKRGSAVNAKVSLLSNLRWGNRISAGDPVDEVGTHSGTATAQNLVTV